MTDLDKKIWGFFRVKKNDNLPYVGWKKSTREDLYEFMGINGDFTLGAEIGVERGINAKQMLDRIPGLHLICVDPWRPYLRTTQEKVDKRKESCKRRLRDRDVEYLTMPSVEASTQIKDRSLDFVYIDGLHDFDSVIQDILAWVPKVRTGGIISGHDFFFSFSLGVVEAVQAYTRAHNIQNWYLTRVDTYPTWFWVNK
jgi:predicted O-methyltransferase YrrM